MDEGNWIFLLVIAGVAIAALLAWRYQHARRSELADLAAELGFFFYADGVPQSAGQGDLLGGLMGLLGAGGPDARYRSFGVFDHGRDRRAYNTLQGSLMLPMPDGTRRPCEAVMGDFRYTTGSGKNQRTSHFSYLIVELPHGPVPETIVRPEGFFDQVAGFMGFDDIDFESAEFSDAFHVKSADKRFAYDLCDPRMMQFLLASRPCMFEIDRFHLCISSGRKRFSPLQFKQHIAWTAAFIDHWPRHLTDRLAPRPTLPAAEPAARPTPAPQPGLAFPSDMAAARGDFGQRSRWGSA